MLRAAVKLRIVYRACGRCGPRVLCAVRSRVAQRRRSPLLTRVRRCVWVHDPVLVFYPSSHACARLPETVQSQSGHVCGGTFFVAVAASRNPTRTVRAARVRRPWRFALRGFQDRALRDDAGRHIPPQRDHQLAGHGDDPDPPRAFALPKVRLIPLREARCRLPAHPIPRELNTDRLQARIAGATDPLLARRASPLSYGVGAKPSRPPICRRFRNARHTKPFVEQHRRARRRHALQLDQLPHRTRRRRGRHRGLLLRVQLGDLRLEPLQTRPRRAPAALALPGAAPRRPNRAPSSTSPRAGATAASRPTSPASRASD